ncbi:MAG: hypothetical protein E1N59_3257 [Puniceicoccaceae bacterium 5H]|nr:MAG: hypothetical protein E1N59_3257 [Puniceicoccaceae bacterium 5H]
MADTPSPQEQPESGKRKDYFPLPWVLISILLYILFQTAYLLFFSER